MHDNLLSRKSPETTEAVYKRGRHVKCQVPYQPHNAPIKWAFGQIGCWVCRRWDVIFNEHDLIADIHVIIETRAGLGGFDNFL